jgi:hypothetical protein
MPPNPLKGEFGSAKKLRSAEKVPFRGFRGEKNEE